MVANLNKPLTPEQFKSYSKVEVLKHTKLWISPDKEEFWSFKIYEYGTKDACIKKSFIIEGDKIPTNNLLNYLRKMYISDNEKFFYQDFLIQGREVSVEQRTYNCEDALFYLNADIKERHAKDGNHAVFIYGYKEPFYMPDNMRAYAINAPTRKTTRKPRKDMIGATINRNFRKML